MMQYLLKTHMAFNFFFFCGKQVFVFQGQCSVDEFITSFLALHFTVQFFCEFFILLFYSPSFIHG